MVILRPIVTNFRSSVTLFTYYIGVTASEEPRLNLKGCLILATLYFLLSGFLLLPLLIVFGEGFLEYEILYPYSAAMSSFLTYRMYVWATKKQNNPASVGLIGMKGSLSSIIVFVMVVIARILFAVHYNGINLEIVNNAINSSSVILIGFVGLLFLKPVAHELFFRGIIQNHLKLSFVPAVAISLSSLIYSAFLTIPQYHGDLNHSMLLFSIFFFQGILLGSVYHTSGNFATNVVVHIMIDVFILIWALT